MSKNNVSKILADIVPPKNKKIVRSSPFPESRKKFELPEIAEGRQKIKFFRLLAIIAVLLIALLGTTMWSSTHYTIGDALTAYRSFLSSALFIQENNSDIATNNAEQLRVGSSETVLFANVLELIKKFREAPNLASSLQEFNKVSVLAETSTRTFQNNWFRWIWGDGDNLMSHLKEAKNKNVGVTETLLKMRNAMVNLGVDDNIPSNFLALYTEAQKRNTLFSSINDLLSNEVQIAIFFMDDSEMRATGGIIRHYAVARIKEGEVQELSIHDIRRHNVLPGERVIPPSPLTRITTNWNAQNANWFFDFPTSVSKIFGFLEKSATNDYKETKFDGAIALNYKVITDILRATGPIELPDYGIVLDHHNFVATVHKELVENTVFRADEQNIFNSLLPELISRIKIMHDSDKNELMRNFLWRLNNKDIQIYFSDETLQGFISESLWDGGIYKSSEAKYSDYLAVVVSNIGGEKTDEHTRQKISLQSVINLDGSLSNELSITRIHEGDRTTEAFYRAPNQTHIRALLPQGATLVSLSGGDRRREIARRGVSGEIRDADVELFEDGVESGKAVLHEWITVARGQSRTLVMKYTREMPFTDRFRFVFEKQSGVDKAFSYTLQAPPGFIFKETGNPIFEHKSVILPTRLIIDLTLQRI